MHIHSRKMNVDKDGEAMRRDQMGGCKRDVDVFGVSWHCNHCHHTPISQLFGTLFPLVPDVNFDELARSTDDFNGAMLKAVCVEAGE